MAEEGAEQGFLQSHALNADAEAAGGSDSDDYDPSETIPEQFSANLAASNHNAIPHMSPFASSSTSTPAPGSNLPQKLPQELNNNDYALALPPSGVEPKESTAMSQIGVFEEGSTDDEDGGDAEYEPPAAALSAQVQNSISTSADMSQRSLSENINEPVPQFHVQQQNIASDQNTPHVSINFPASDSHVDHSVHSDGTLKPMQGESKLPGRSAAQSANSSLPSTPPVAATSRTRLPHDRLGILEDRIQADPRGDTDAWLELISEHRSRNKLDNARQVYERFFKVFPSAAEQWVAYATMESENNELYKLEQIFTKCLLSIPNVQLWSLYLDYVRRRNNLTTDSSGDARRTISSAYDLALQHIGIDKDSGNIWVDYIQFLRSGPGNIGGSGWQDQQKMDLLRKAYQRAICVPTQAVNTLWKEYDQFEMGLNKLTGRKFIQDKSPSYMTARSSYTELQNITRDLVRLSLPRLPPAPGYEGDYSFSKQVEIWKRWIQWEKDDPLVLKEEDLAGYKQRTLYVYKQALMALRFVPEIFFDTADFCFQNGMETEGNDFLKQGIEANPESCLLAFKRADRLELSSASEQDPKKRGARVREPYDKLLDALYELIGQVRAQEATDVARLEEQAAQGDQEQPAIQENDDDDDETGNPRTNESAKSKEIDLVKKDYAGKIGVLSKAVSFVWIALMRAMRRIQGKGKPGEIAGSRQIFADARKRGRITSDVYIASALLEYHCYKDPAATKIFERGAKLFPEDEVFALEYLKHLIDINDITNARAVFETTVRRLASNPENVAKAKPIFAFLHEYESRYGDLVQINNLESRMRELFPEDPTLKQFAHRFSAPSFDPTTFQPVLSPSQLKPRTISSLEEPSSRHSSPAIRHPTTTTHSPKRSFPLDEYGDEPNRPRKFIRAESPLKGAAGRRDQQKRLQSNGSGGGPAVSRVKQQQQQPPSAGPLPRDVVYLLSIIPPASAYDATRFSPEMMVNLLRQVELPSNVSQLRLPTQQTGGGSSHQRHQYHGGYRPNP
ncbi:mRNA 3'-end-processing protein rna14 [Arthroderma sp. PD_2]|nr:mRNA 3'-end-processing protein rna14 [Arthroderma sp. PD_2]